VSIIDTALLQVSFDNTNMKAILVGSWHLLSQPLKRRLLREQDRVGMDSLCGGLCVFSWHGRMSA
jgi:hypothetical protein